MTASASLTALVADLGGTNTRVALTDGATVRTDTVRRFRNKDHADLPSVLRAYVTGQSVTPEAACVAMAGPVRDGVGTLTNLNWTVDREAIAEATGATTVAVLNDLQAQGHALDLLTEDVVQTVLPGKPAPAQAVRLVIGIGTGMNAAAVYRLGFADAFYDKGRFSEFLHQFPVHLVDDDFAALTGSAAHLMELIG